MFPAADNLARDFWLFDQYNQRFSLADHLADSEVILVFFRGHWCPYCRRYLQKLCSRYNEFTARSARVAGISPEPSNTTAAFAREFNVPFPMLSDCDGEVFDLYQARNRFAASRALMPHPAVFVIDRQSRIRFRSIDRDYRRRTTIRTILTSLDEIAAAPGTQLV